MALKITAPDGLTGENFGIQFTDGGAEVDSVDVATFNDLVANGFIIDGVNVPTAEELAAAAGQTAQG